MHISSILFELMNICLSILCDILVPLSFLFVIPANLLSENFNFLENFSNKIETYSILINFNSRKKYECNYLTVTCKNPIK